MRIAHLDLFSGISGDMTLGALVDAGASFRELRRMLAALPLRGYVLRSRPVMKGPIRATQVEVKIPKPHHHHTSLREILALVKRSRLPEPVRRNAAEVFSRLGGAEGKIHGVDPLKVEFHEVGAVDSIVDIVGACAGFHLLEIEEITCTPVPITRGTIHGEHGPIPLPGPATMDLLRGFPMVSLDLDREIVTPTGAAILAALARPGDFREMRLTSVGYGAGGWDLPRPNVLRIFVGESARPEESDVVYEVQTNLDNAPGDLVGYVFERLFAAGALDVYTVPIQMKKSRPGILLSVLVSPSRRREVEAVLLAETPTLGVRRALLERSKLDRREETVQTAYGPIRVKVGLIGGRPAKRAPEYEDVRAAATRHAVTFARVWDAAARMR